MAVYLCPHSKADMCPMENSERTWALLPWSFLSSAVSPPPPELA